VSSLDEQQFQKRINFYNKVKEVHYLTAGLRLFANAIPLRCDSWTSCTNFCRYCFARALARGSQARAGIKYDPRVARMADIKRLYALFYRIFDKKEINPHSFIELCLARKYFIENGTQGEPFQEADLKYRVTYNYLLLLKNYNYPLYVTTKANLLIESEKYYDLLVSLKKNGLIVDITIIGINDSLVKTVEPQAPSVKERLNLVERLVSDGVDVTISVRPIIDGITTVNFDTLIETLCKLKVKSIHLRNFYITGHLLSVWKPWIDKNKDILKRYGVGYAYKRTYLDYWFQRALEIAKKYDVAITGQSIIAHLNTPFHKLDYEKANPEVKSHLFPYTVYPIFKKIAEHKNERLELTYKEYLKPLLESGDKMLEQEILMTYEVFPLIYYQCCQQKPRVLTMMPLKEIIKRSLWSGWEIKNINAVRGGGSYLLRYAYIKPKIVNDVIERDEEGNPIFIYEPPSEEKPKAYLERQLHLDSI
jgi:DNA repair photolyase